MSRSRSTSRTRTALAATALATAAAALAPAAASAAAPSHGLESAYDKVYSSVEKHGGEPGRNIVDDGKHSGEKARPASAAEVRSSLVVLRRMKTGLTGEPQPAGTRGAATAPAAASTASSTATATSSGSATATGQASTAAPAASGSAGGGLEGVAACESGGDPGAVSADGQYRGKYQFDQQTWEPVGGSGDPASAPEATQDALAQKLQSQRGSSPWPVCGG